MDLHASHYTFDERLLDDVADELIATGNAQSAVEVLKLDRGALFRGRKLWLGQAGGSPRGLGRDARQRLQERIPTVAPTWKKTGSTSGRPLVPKRPAREYAAMIFELDRAASRWSSWAYAGKASVLKDKGDLEWRQATTDPCPWPRSRRLRRLQERLAASSGSRAGSSGPGGAEARGHYQGTSNEAARSSTIS